MDWKQLPKRRLYKICVRQWWTPIRILRVSPDVLDRVRLSNKAVTSTVTNTGNISHPDITPVSTWLEFSVLPTCANSGVVNRPARRRLMRRNRRPNSCEISDGIKPQVNEKKKWVHGRTYRKVKWRINCLETSRSFFLFRHIKPRTRIAMNFSGN
jgi:hypothetical protein